MKLKFLPWENKSWTHSDLIALTGVAATVLEVVVALAPDEVRCVIHLSSQACPPPSHPSVQNSSIVQDGWHHVYQFFSTAKDTDYIAESLSGVRHHVHQFFVSVKDTEHVAERVSGVWHRFAEWRTGVISSRIK